MVLLALSKSKRNLNASRFSCIKCKKSYWTEYLIPKITPDFNNPGVFWYANRRIEGFICPDSDCESRHSLDPDYKLENMYFVKIDENTQKKIFQCKTCQKRCSESINLRPNTISRLSKKESPVRRFSWIDDLWDLRSINPNFDRRDNRCTVNFDNLTSNWFKNEAKKYIHHLCKSENSFSTIISKLNNLKPFSQYLVRNNISTFDEINRSLVINYLSQEKRIDKDKLCALREFFTLGNIGNWFNVESDIIRNEDYPKRYRGNPDPISNIVREQIEQNLYRLPDPIARMWLIGYFSAMRPSELALLKQDCLVQEGQNWKLVWHRKKTNDYHEIPITITIAKVVQQQQKYIGNLWGNEWDYLFCHYYNLSNTDPSQSNLKPIKKILPSQVRHPLSTGICTLIKALDIRDENGQPAKFTPQLLRSTRLTELFDQGHDLSVVSAWAGHKHFVTTSTYYTEVSCDLMQREAGHIHQALVNSDGNRISYESFPKSFWDNPVAHKLEVGATHINTPIYGYCGLRLDQDCHKFRACYTCRAFAATIEKLPQYINILNELRAKSVKAMSAGQEVLVEQFGRQVEQLDKIIASLQQEAA